MQVDHSKLKLVYVDFDGTLVRSTSLHYLVALRAFHLKKYRTLISLSMCLLAWACIPLILILHQTSEMARDRLLILLYWGLSSADLNEGACQYWRENQASVFRLAVLDLIRSYHQKDYRIVIVSGSLYEIIYPAIQACGMTKLIDGYLTPELVYGSDRKLTGRLIGKPNIQLEKIERIRTYESSEQIHAVERVAVTDSTSDLPLLNFCDAGIVVSPKRKLRAEAYERNWSIIDDLKHRLHETKAKLVH
ncbi:MAG: HAD family hydrolase [Oligoflexus sp.]